MNPSPAEDCKFFEYGEVKLEVCDFKSRQALIFISMPCCLFQTVTPHLLGGGYVDDFKVRHPVAFWIPKLTQNRFVPVAQQIENTAEKVNIAINEEIDRIGKIFVHLQDYLVDPSDLIPILPLGTYITCRFRCRVDDIIKILEGVNSIPVVGVLEFQWALATVLYQVLSDFNKVEFKQIKRGT